MITQSFQNLLEKSASEHSHLCPRQVIGVRMGLLAGQILGLELPQSKKRLLAIVETDGCFADGVSAATGCTVGHRTLRIEDFGKTGAVFIDTASGNTVRIAPNLDVRQRAKAYAPAGESRRYFAQLHGYQIMPDIELFTVEQVILSLPVETIISHPGARVNCDGCGEEIINEREIRHQNLTLCRTCAGQSYYQPVSRNLDLLYRLHRESA